MVKKVPKESKTISRSLNVGLLAGKSINKTVRSRNLHSSNVPYKSQVTTGISSKAKIISLNRGRRHEKYLKTSYNCSPFTGERTSQHVNKASSSSDESIKYGMKYLNSDESRIETDVSDYSPIKTRGFIKNRAKIKNRCRICKSETGSFMACIECSSKFHLMCLGYSPESAENVSKRRAGDWQCPMCILCSECSLYIYDAENVQCFYCDRAYHGKCIPGTSSSNYSLKDSWYCPECKVEQGASGTTIFNPVPARNIGRRKSFGKIMADAWSGEDSEIQRRRNELNDSMKDKCSMRILMEARRLQDFRRHMEQENCSPKKSSKNRSASEATTTSLKHLELLQNCKTVDGVKVECLSGDGVDKLQRSERQTSEAKMKQISISFDYENYKAAKAGSKKKSFLEKKSSSRQVVHFGPEAEFEAPYKSAYRKCLAESSHLYVCQFCLVAVEDEVKFENHLTCCEWRHPPGNEIYRDGIFSFWEIDGESEKPYCQRLCLFAKLFLSSKTLHREVEMFLFYLLTKYTADGCVIVGYFSKEKSPSKNNNLSCILTIPSSLRCGYGHFLIDLSYKLSLREKKVGGPEHPLSDLGVVTYRNYWKAVLISYIRKCRPATSFSIKEMTCETGVHPQDIVSTLRHCRMLMYRGGNYYVDVKKAYMAPLKCLRRRTVKDELLVWEPEFEVDSEKIGNYASNKSLF